jgi:hypothetical protein
LDKTGEDIGASRSGRSRTVTPAAVPNDSPRRRAERTWRAMKRRRIVELAYAMLILFGLAECLAPSVHEHQRAHAEALRGAGSIQVAGR